MSGAYYIEVTEDEDNQRLDRFLQNHLKGVPFGLLQKLMRKGQIRVNSGRVKAATRLVAGQKVRIPPMDAPKEQEKLVLRQSDIDFMKSIVLYDEGDIIAVNKPAGLATQGGTGVKRHLDGMLQALVNDKGVKPRIVHRLDKDTSGVILLARSADMARKLGKIFQTRDIRKIYWALTIPAPEINQGEIRAPIIKAGGEGNEKMVVDVEKGQSAITLFDIVERAHKQMAFVAFWPKTGRTHQIRVHAAHMGCPILGDGKYGGQDAMIDDVDHPRRVHLHAQSVYFKHPDTNKDIAISAELSDEMKKSWRSFGFDDRTNYIPFSDVKDKKKK